MSRTYVHRPWWVLERDPRFRRDFTVQHHHWIREAWDKERRRYLVSRSAPCDLDQRLTGPESANTRCRLYPNGRRQFCACPGCRRPDDRRYQHQQSRAAWRATRQQLLAATRDDLDDIETTPRPDTGWVMGGPRATRRRDADAS